ncbi:hypothetical protein [Chlamydia abortus]|nr:hypothetical protein [Chlamydia abortus]CAD7584534.1 hypothetical protein [Chlamydia abortus]
MKHVFIEVVACIPTVYIHCAKKGIPTACMSKVQFSITMDLFLKEITP